nr:Bardet-Biedl syndrome 1 protein homolog [Ciona intestinalis]|eukprot:XP_002125520.1 Bardet-Biedl syndrome 1 protein homolog [Ciona intestinalis]
MDDEVPTNNNWLNAYYDPVAGIYTFPSCIALADLNSDGDNKLVIADLGSGLYKMTLKVFQGTSVVQENALLDLPTGIVSVYMDNMEPRTPGIVVASGSCLFVYKNMRPYYKYPLPLLPVNEAEKSLWNAVRNGDVVADALTAALSSLKDEIYASALTSQTLRFLQLESRDEAEAFIESHKNVGLKRETVVTCLATMKKSVAEEDAISCLVAGTEHKEIQIIDSEAFTQLKSYNLPSIPVFINVSGLYDVDFRLFVACRDGKIYALKKDSTEYRVCIELGSQVVGMERIHKHMVVATMDKAVSCYTTKGKKLWSLELPANIVCTGIMDQKAKGFKALMVGLDNNEIRIYKDKNLVDTLTLNDRPQAICYGRYGREDSTLVSVTSSGALNVHILKRTAEYSEQSGNQGQLNPQKTKLNIPKKTQLFVDQTVREREHGTEMFQSFQHDLQLIRLQAAKTYIHGLNSSITPISDDPDIPLKLNATVQGIGPVFQMMVTVENTASSTASDPKLVSDLKMMFKFSDKVYTATPRIFSLPPLVPGIPYRFPIRIECIATDQPAQDTVTAVVFTRSKPKPIVTANISMPVSEGVVVV